MNKEAVKLKELKSSILEYRRTKVAKIARDLEYLGYSIDARKILEDFDKHFNIIHSNKDII